MHLPDDDRTRQIRLVVEAAHGYGLVETRDAVETVLGKVRWSVEPLFPEDPDQSFLITGQGDAEFGEAEYSRRAANLAHSLQDTGMFTEVEADIPVDGFDPDINQVGPYGGGPPERPPGTEVMRWARDAIRISEAWDFSQSQGRPSQGAGVRIGHPDTGYTHHPRLGVTALDLTTDHDFIYGDDDATDPLLRRGPFSSPGHGTSTASVIAGRGSETVGIVGVAPQAIVVPLRATISVVQLFDSDVARAVDYARRNDCHVISMSLGGKGFFGLERAILRAVESGIVVMAAAGNNVRFVVAPASYLGCIAVAATGIGDRRWSGSSRGDSVDVAAPGEAVHVANFNWDNPPSALYTTGRSDGTSYAVAHLAGVAALWLAHHGRDALINRFGASRLQTVFRHLLDRHGVRSPPDWDPRYGTGIVDARSLLEAALPAPSLLDQAVGPAAVAPRDSIDRISVLLDDMDRNTVEQRLADLLGVNTSNLPAVLARYEGELAYLLMTDEAFRQRLIRLPSPDPATGRPPAPQGASDELQTVINTA
jgi:hypothetical protein